MDKYSLIKDFFTESIKVNLGKIFSFDCMKELQNEMFSTSVLDEIFLKRIPIIVQIMSSNAVDDCNEVIYPLLKEKITEVTKSIDKIEWDAKGDYRSAKLNGVRFKIVGCISLMTLSLTKGGELRDELKGHILEYIRGDGVESFNYFLTDFLSKIEGVGKCLDKIKQVLDISNIPKTTIDKFIDSVCMKKRNENSLQYCVTTSNANGNMNSNAIINSVKVSNLDSFLYQNNDKNINTFLSKKRNPPKAFQNQNEINDSNIAQIDKGKNKSIDDYFKGKEQNNNFKNINSVLHTDPKPTTNRNKKKISKNEDELSERPPAILDFLSFKRSEQIRNSNNKLNALIHYPSLTNSFNKSTSYSNSFGNFDVTSFHNSEISSVSKTTLSNPTLTRGINSKLGSCSILQKFSSKKKKKAKRNHFSERIIEKCLSFCGPIIKPQQGSKPENSNLNNLKKIVQNNFYSNQSNNTSGLNSKENSNNVPWHLSTPANNNIISNIDTKEESSAKPVDEKEKDKEKPREKGDESDDEILAYKTPEKGQSAKFDNTINHITLKRNLYALFTQTLK